jgi:hypothetical protein
MIGRNWIEDCPVNSPLLIACIVPAQLGIGDLKDQTALMMRSLSVTLMLENEDLEALKISA